MTSKNSIKITIPKSTTPMSKKLDICHEAVSQMNQALLELRGSSMWGSPTRPSLYESFLLTHRVLERVEDIPSVWILDMLNMLRTPIPCFSLNLGAWSNLPWSWAKSSSWIYREEAMRRGLPRNENPRPEYWPAFPGQEQCELCNKVGQKCYTDHCHMTHRVRGRLCQSCNRKVNAMSAPEWILRAETSKEKYKILPKKRELPNIISVWRTYSVLREDFPCLDDPGHFFQTEVSA